MVLYIYNSGQKMRDVMVCNLMIILMVNILYKSWHLTHNIITGWLCIVKFALMKQHLQQQRQPDLLVEPGLVKHSVFEVDGVCVAAELDVVTNCVNVQFQLPLRALNHRAAWLRICLYHLHANIWMHNCELTLSSKLIINMSLNIQHMYLILHRLCS